MWIVGGILIGIVTVVSLWLGPPFVPTHSADLEALFRELDIKQKTFVDLGAGDGRVVAQAAHFGASRAIGYEVNPLLWLIGRWQVREYAHATIKLRPWQLASAEADVVYMFGSSREMSKKKLQNYIANKTFVTYGAVIPHRTGVRCGAHTIYQPVALHQ